MLASILTLLEQNGKPVPADRLRRLGGREVESQHRVRIDIAIKYCGNPPDRRARIDRGDQQQLDVGMENRVGAAGAGDENLVFLGARAAGSNGIRTDVPRLELLSVETLAASDCQWAPERRC